MLNILKAWEQRLVIVSTEDAASLADDECQRPGQQAAISLSMSKYCFGDGSHLSVLSPCGACHLTVPESSWRTPPS